MSPHQLFGIRLIYLFNRCSSQPTGPTLSGTEMTEVKKYIIILVLGELIFKWGKQKVKKINRWNLPCVRCWWVIWRKRKHRELRLLAVHFHLSHTGLGVGWTQHFWGNLFSHIGSPLALLWSLQYSLLFLYVYIFISEFIKAPKVGKTTPSEWFRCVKKCRCCKTHFPTILWRFLSESFLPLQSSFPSHGPWT